MSAQEWATIGRGIRTVLLIVAAVLVLAFLLGQLQGGLVALVG